MSKDDPFAIDFAIVWAEPSSRNKKGPATADPSCESRVVRQLPHSVLELGAVNKAFNKVCARKSTIQRVCIVS